MPKVAIEELINKINSRDADKGFEGSSYVFDRGADDIESKPDDTKQYLRMTLTSETPIEDWFGYLILDHSPGAIVTSRLDQKSCSWRDGHWGDQIGYIEDYTINQNRKLEVGVMHSPHNPRAVILYKDYRDKYRKNTSARFIVRELKLDKTIDEVDYYRALKWELIHGAAVPDGADENVGVDRNLKTKNIYQLNNRSNTMTPEEIAAKEKADRELAAKAASDREIQIAEEKKREALLIKERAKVNLSKERGDLLDRSLESKGPDAVVEAVSIYDMARSYQDEFKGTDIDLQRTADDYVKLGQSSASFGKHITNLLSERQQKTLSLSMEGMSKKDREKFSFAKLVDAADKSRGIDISRELGMIKEYSQQNNLDLTPKRGGVVVPLGMLYNADRTLITSTPTSAGNLVATNLLANEFIPLPRNRSVVDKLGCVVFPNLIGNQAIPTQTGAASGSWMTDEVTPPSASDLTTGQKTLQAKTYKAKAAFSRLASLNTTPGIERIAVEDLIKIVMLARDKAVHHGAGSSGEPSGIVVTNGVGLGTIKTTFTNGDMIDMETAVADANLDEGTMGYVTTPTLRGTLKKTLRDSGVPGYIWEKNEVNGYNSMASKQITAGYIFFGDYSNVVIGEWGGLELVYNPYSDDGAIIRVSAYLTMDVAIRNAGAFSFYKPS